MKIKDYCTQNDNDCDTCSLVNYGYDCRNNKVTEKEFSEVTWGTFAEIYNAAIHNAADNAEKIYIDDDDKAVIEDFLKAYDEKILALGRYLNLSVIETINGIYEDQNDNNIYNYGKEEYLVLTNSEANKAWDESLDSYIDDVILSEIPRHYHNYFNDYQWKDDARMDGRGISLAAYDKKENKQEYEGTTYYIYRLI